MPAADVNHCHCTVMLQCCLAESPSTAEVLPHAQAVLLHEGQTSTAMSHSYKQYRLVAMLAYPPDEPSIRIGGRPGLIAACPQELLLLLLLRLLVFKVSKSKHDTLADRQQRRIHNCANHVPK
jgi:hypothetical protein